MIDSLNKLLEEELKDIYSAEKQLLKALPKMARQAASDELRSALEEHTEVTRAQVNRLEQVFESLGSKAKAKTCKAMQGLVEEAEEVMDEDAEDAVMDAGIIAAAQKVEHYEIASYGTVRTWARLCGQEEAARLLQETLDEEAETDERLTQLAESFVNPEAEAGNAGSGKSARGRSSGGKSSGKKSRGKSQR
ncbi:MAG: ferritin-like domain-containing protein [Chthoniobacterales bacterium]